MLRVSKLTDYATVVMTCLAAAGDGVLSAQQLAERVRLEVPTVSKLLKQLHRAGLVISTRGTHGGYQLARDPEAISAAAILDALEGPIALTDCSNGAGHCGIEHTCSVGRAWQKLNVAIRRSLSEISLAQLAGLDNRNTHMPIERELRHIQRGAKVPS